MNIRTRTTEFCDRVGLRVPILLAPMAGASAPALSVAVANAGGLGACGALLMASPEIVAWANEVRNASSGRFQINLWIPDPSPVRHAAREKLVRDFLAIWGPAVAPDAGNATPPDFVAQCEALLEARRAVVSSVMGLYPSAFVARLKALGIAWFANTIRQRVGLCQKRLRHHNYRPGFADIRRRTQGLQSQSSKWQRGDDNPCRP
jgi:nitronate monooxygenase